MQIGPQSDKQSSAPIKPAAAHHAHISTTVAEPKEASLISHIYEHIVAVPHPPLPSHQWGDVVILVGSSTAGKSSIIKELLRQKKDMVEQGIDLAALAIDLKYLQTNHAQEMAFLQSAVLHTEELEKTPFLLLHYIFDGVTPLLRDGVDPAQFRIVCQELKKSRAEFPMPSLLTVLMDDVLAQAKSGRCLVFDLLEVQDIFNHAISKHPSLKIALVYCPFQTLAQRVVVRNAEAVQSKDPFNIRPGVFPLEQFAELFRPKQNAQDEVVQSLSRSQAEEAFDLLFDNGIAYEREHEPKALENRDLPKERQDKKAALLEKLGLNQQNVVELTPKFKGYHLLINTASTDKHKQEATQEAMQILFKK